MTTKTPPAEPKLEARDWLSILAFFRALVALTPAALELLQRMPREERHRLGRTIAALGDDAALFLELGGKGDA